MKEEKLENLPIEWLRGNGLRKSDLTENGKNKCILYGELYTKHRNVWIEGRNISRTNKFGSIYSCKGDILVPGTSTASKKDMLLAREIGEDGVYIGGDINIIRPQNGLFAEKYIPYFFETFRAYDQLDRYITGATGIIHISNSGLKKLKIPLPPLSEQRRIVSILDSCFAAIDKAKANAEKNLQNTRELFESYLQGVFEGKGEGWVHTRLGDICKINDGTHFSPKNSNIGDYMYITAKNIKPFYIDLNNISYVSKDDHKEIYSRCYPKKGDVLYIKDGATAGIATVNTIEEEFSMLSSVALIKCSDKISNHFLVYYMNSAIGKRNFLGYVDGAAITRLTLAKIKDVCFSIPPVDMQQTIVRQLDSLRAETQKLEAVYKQKLADMEELKKSLLEKAFRGELTTDNKITQ
jgi:type I restriction enzyme S subunit